jgi:hypothetical protein
MSWIYSYLPSCLLPIQYSQLDEEFENPVSLSDTENSLLNLFTQTIVNISNAEHSMRCLLKCLSVNRGWQKIATCQSLWQKIFEDCYGQGPEMLTVTIDYFATCTLYKRIHSQLKRAEILHNPNDTTFSLRFGNAMHLLWFGLKDDTIRTHCMTPELLSRIDWEAMQQVLIENKPAFLNLRYFKLSIFNDLTFLELDDENIGLLVYFCQYAEVINFFDYLGPDRIISKFMDYFVEDSTYSPNVCTIILTSKQISTFATNFKPPITGETTFKIPSGRKIKFAIQDRDSGSTCFVQPQSESMA